MNAWVTLLTDAGYVVGVRTLRASLARTGTPYPLVVLVTDDVGAADRRLLEDDGCLLQPVEPLRPASGLQDSYANARFAQVWTKLRAWQLTDYERVVVLDADMLVTQSMDELFAMSLPDNAIAACHACRCNPNRIASYPASWTPDTCFYTHCRGMEHTTEPGVESYLNGGFLVVTPDGAVFEQMVTQLAEVDDLSHYVFAEQDFLNEFYSGRWVPLPYVYNALKTLAFQHPQLWDLGEVKNIHYIIDKPWQSPLDEADRYFPVNELWWEVATQLPQPYAATP